MLVRLLPRPLRMCCLVTPDTLLDQAGVPGRQRARGHDAVQPQVPGQQRPAYEVEEPGIQ